MILSDIWVFTIYQALFECFTYINSINAPNIPTRQNLFYLQFTKEDIWDKDRELVQWLHRNREPWYRSILESSVQFSSVAWSCPTLCDPMSCSTPGNSQSLPKLMSIESVIPSNHLILYRPLLLLPSIFPSIRVFSNESALHIRWPKYWSFSFNISPSNEYSGLISFRTDWLNLFPVQGTLKSLLQHHSSKASILWCSAFFTVQLSHPYMTTGKSIALTRWAFVGKIMSLLFNMLSRLVMTFLPRSKRLLISWLQLSSAVILEPPKIKPAPVSTVSHLFSMKWWDRMPWS